MRYRVKTEDELAGEGWVWKSDALGNQYMHAPDGVTWYSFHSLVSLWKPRGDQLISPIFDGFKVIDREADGTASYTWVHVSLITSEAKEETTPKPVIIHKPDPCTCTTAVLFDYGCRCGQAAKEIAYERSLANDQTSYSNRA